MVDTISEALDGMAQRYEDPKIKKMVKDFNQPIELTFDAEDHKVMILINGDQGIEVKDNEGDDSAPVKIHMESEQVLIDLSNKKLGAVAGYSSGRIKIVEGAIKNLLKLRKLMF
ncbi:MAG TPA: SCP2 sterol-binding domain-containing protein [Candidatus Lokiarchaeia archaeon]|nr:SCP2 sterol-binding domain-containing protein [Candidatus Lokiarchaeia archaeon]